MLTEMSISYTKKNDLRCAVVGLRSDGIMHFAMKSVDEITEKDVKEILNAVSQIGNGKKFCNLITFQEYISISKEAKEFSASPEGNLYTIADAFVLHSVPLVIVGKFYLKFNNPICPTKIFKSEEKAIAWLKTF